MKKTLRINGKKTQTEGQIGLTKTTTHLGKIGERETETTIGTITTIIKQGITTAGAIMTKMNQGTTITGTDTNKTDRGGNYQRNNWRGNQTQPNHNLN